ncbi:hypothetical protein JCM19241_38 [Vibrio ishigakensis]|uniref:SPOR domain-containing protein n=1 Tax=Vibrio ishigakensis TaxID=1481914 RepID=A0A0B8QXB6_9VIBR|nr:hypothetical protein JCM19241_38 [Vibrio ishigakensis]
MTKDYQQPSFVESKDKTNRIFVGPISEANTAQDVLKKLKQDGFTSAFIKKHKVQ